MKPSGKWTTIVEILMAIAIGFVLASIIDLPPWGAQSDRRYHLYGLQRSLQKGDTRDQVEEIICRHAAPFLQRAESEEGTFLYAPTGGATSCRLELQFAGDRLVSARIRGHDSENHRYKDSPPDIE